MIYYISVTYKGSSFANLVKNESVLKQNDNFYPSLFF